MVMTNTHKGSMVYCISFFVRLMGILCNNSLHRCVIIIEHCLDNDSGITLFPGDNQEALTLDDYLVFIVDSCVGFTCYQVICL